jgi:hypothetical protein
MNYKAFQPIAFGSFIYHLDISPIFYQFNERNDTSFVERQNGTDRHLNARKARKTLEFSGVSGSSDPERLS